MTQRQDPHPIRDFFVGDLVDYAPKDSRDMMERPFFSLAKRKRNQPIEYEDAEKTVYVKVTPNPRLRRHGDDLGRRHPYLVHFADHGRHRPGSQRRRADHLHDTLRAPERHRPRHQWSWTITGT